ncbi:MAG TPA: tRNA (adenosine(37)-N6)-dimethylallyltransferase MiaA [Acidimicrobiales bacterium]|jgi:tRNA dimethylallyltransferase|nr:tRNA (adenosine(37)-N6)-dimethylallyltransferase MiaA [Acidimicrobiales bacterium]
MTAAPEPSGRHLALVGTTASGKSAVAFEIARRRPDIELVSVDSMCVYRGMDVGTAKPTPAQRAEVPHHLLDLADPSEDYSVSRFQAAARDVLDGIEARGHRALLVGGTGLYLQAVVDDLELPGQWPEVAAELEAEADRPGGVGTLHARLADLDPVAAHRMGPSNRRRVVRALEVTLGSGRRFSSFGPGLAAYPSSRFTLVGLRLPAPVVARRIEERFLAQLGDGFLQEVRILADRPEGLSRTARQALGYRELLGHVERGVPLDEATADGIRRTRSFARRQRAWFRRDPRIAWIDPVDPGGDANPLAVIPTLLGHWIRCPSSA